MPVMVDEAVWPWRGRRWAHLASDSSLAELHEFAARLGIPPRAFQGDHYDVTAELRQEALDLGAEAVPARQLVRRLRQAGLRRRHAPRIGP
ncbi:MAG: DUF4031 domain-containing protein [Acidimicrobiales bacterium]|nr:DUF4031 domain-containing protein [Acidimicrobiales bacterium]MCB1247814.1 DUF4031 domain-containing protein [Acidimicrobiales bacterium]MCB1260887.1 DUF4031 domain-containing protein [Acidimicrobiales bacterium]